MKRDPLSASFNVELAVTDFRRGRVAEAVSRLRQTLAKYPQSPGALTNLAVVLEANRSRKPRFRICCGRGNGCPIAPGSPRIWQGVMSVWAAEPRLRLSSTS